MTKKQHLLIPVNVRILKNQWLDYCHHSFSELGLSGFVSVCPKSKSFLLFIPSFSEMNHCLQ